MAVKLQTMSYVIFSDQKLVVGFFGGEATATRTKSVTWDISRTIVTGARLVVTASSDQSFLPTAVKVNFNGQEVLFGDVTGVTVSQSIDISALLENGVNTISATGLANLHGATVTVTISLEIDFESPTGGTPTPPNFGGAVGGIPLKTIALVGGGAFLLVLAIVFGGRRK